MMGDRVSIAFVHGGRESVALFSHWGGVEFANMAQGWADNLSTEMEKATGVSYPLHRLEPDTVMVEFIRDVVGSDTSTHGGPVPRIYSSYYLGRDWEDGDNSDNGHYRIELGRDPALRGKGLLVSQGA